jgi:hypothetical protein
MARAICRTVRYRRGLDRHYTTPPCGTTAMLAAATTDPIEDARRRIIGRSLT